MHSPKHSKKAAFLAAFPHTLPVLTGYAFLGMAYGILMDSKGYGLIWTFLMSTFGFAGSAQYVAITALTTVFNPISAFLITLMVNARHIFYGVSMLGDYQGAGRLKPYLIFGLTDETFSIVCSAKPPEQVNKYWFYFFVTLLDHSYWVLGSLAGSLIGSLISFNTKGLDFVLTALFVVIFVGQWQSQKNHWPALVGVGSSLIMLLILGPSRFIIPAMMLILLLLTVFRRNMPTDDAQIEDLISDEALLNDPKSDGGK
ncbi:MAG: AzlC family ABC transporter permease [Eubacteriales bacterium]|nr:AzlC family ABC transporter permease [Eubacteriales bacterium]